MIIVFALFILNLLGPNSPPDYAQRVFFKSPALRGLELTPLAGEFSMLDDTGKKVRVVAMEDGAGVPYWYREILTSVCLTGECKMVNIGIYWYCNGDFMGLEVYDEHLTKTDHSVFSDADYDKLLEVLGNDWSSLREYELSDLMTEGAENSAAAESSLAAVGIPPADVTTGATRKELTEEAVEGAVYTTFTLWHLAHLGEKEQLEQLTAGLLNQEGLAGRMLQQGDMRYRYFLLELLAGAKIPASQALTLLQIEGMNATGQPLLRSLSIRSLSNADLDHPLLQPSLAEIYPKASIDEKLQILNALEDLPDMNKALCQALTADLSAGNEWFSIKLLKVLQGVTDPGAEALKAARALMKSENSLVKEAAGDFIALKNNNNDSQ